MKEKMFGQSSLEIPTPINPTRKTNLFIPPNEKFKLYPKG